MFSILKIFNKRKERDKGRKQFIRDFNILFKFFYNLDEYLDNLSKSNDKDAYIKDIEILYKDSIEYSVSTNKNPAGFIEVKNVIYKYIEKIEYLNYKEILEDDAEEVFRIMYLVYASTSFAHNDFICEAYNKIRIVDPCRLREIRDFYNNGYVMVLD